MTVKQLRGWALLACVTALASCSRCGKSGGAPVALEAMLPRHSVGVVIAPKAATVGEKLRVVEGLKVASFIAQLQGFSDAHGWADALFGALGFDVRSPALLEKAGVDPQRGFAFAMTLEGWPFLVLPVKDEGRLKETLTHLASARFGATQASEEAAGGLTVHRLGAPGQPPRFGWVVAHGWALVASEGAVARLGTWASAPEGGGLAGDPQWQHALARLPPSPDLIAWVPPGSPALKSQLGSGAVALTLTPTGLAVTADAPWKGDPEVLQAFARQAGAADLLPLLPDDAFLVARFTGDASKLSPIAHLLLGPYLTNAFQQTGFDLKGQVLDNLKAGGVAALSLSPNANLATGVPELDLKSTNPFGYAHLAGILEAKDASKVPTALEQLAAAAPRFGATIEKKDHEGQTYFLTRYSAGEGVHFAPKGDRVYFGSPLPRLEALLKAEPGKGPLASPALRAALDARAATVVIDLRRLADSVRALPPSAWGIGGFAIKQTTLRWLDATDDLTAVTVGLAAKDGALDAQVLLSLQPAPAAAGSVPAPAPEGAAK